MDHETHSVLNAKEYSSNVVSFVDDEVLGGERGRFSTIPHTYSTQNIAKSRREWHEKVVYRNKLCIQSRSPKVDESTGKHISVKK